jgi:hypothetical protein
MVVASCSVKDPRDDRIVIQNNAADQVSSSSCTRFLSHTPIRDLPQTVKPLMGTSVPPLEQEEANATLWRQINGHRWVDQYVGLSAYIKESKHMRIPNA